MGFWSKLVGQPQTETSTSVPTTSGHQSSSAPRDYLKEAGDLIFGGSLPAPLESLVRDDPQQVVGNLLPVIDSEGGPSATMMRKAAVYALGQIGDPASLSSLLRRYRVEPASGVKEALAACITAINLAPMPTGSQEDRRLIIHDVYEGRRPAVLQPDEMMMAQPALSADEMQGSRAATKVLAASIADVPPEEILLLVEDVLRFDPGCSRSDFLLVASGVFAEVAMKQVVEHDPGARATAAKAIPLATRLLQVERTQDADILFSAYSSLAIAYFCIDEYENALDFSSRALQIMPNSKQMLLIQSTLANG